MGGGVYDTRTRAAGEWGRDTGGRRCRGIREAGERIERKARGDDQYVTNGRERVLGLLQGREGAATSAICVRI